MSGARSWVSFGVIVAFTGMLAGTSKPKASGEGGTSGTSGTHAADPVFKSIPAAAQAAMPAAPCTDALLEATMKTVVLPDTWSKPDKHRLPLVDQPVAAGFTRANAKTNYPDDGFWVINETLVRDLHPKSWNVSDQSDSKISSNASQLVAYPLFALLRSDQRILPKANASGDDFTGGRLTGKLVVTRMDTGAPVCVVGINAKSSPIVTFKSRGLMGKSLEKAIHDDFFEQLGKALKEAMTAAAPTFSIDSGT